MNRIKIMIAEDISILREDIVEYLESKEGFQVTGQASSGREIIQLASLNPPDVILMDIEMENLYSGIKAAEKLTEMKIPSAIIYLSAHDNNDMILTAMATGAVDYIVKGQPYEEMVKHIIAAAKGKPLMEGAAHQLLLQEYQRLRHTEKSLLFFINNLSKLTTSEREIIKLLLQGNSIKEIAEIRVVEKQTVKSQITVLLKKFGAKRSKEIIVMIQNLKLEHLFIEEL